MAHNPISAARLPADDPFFDAVPGNLPPKSGASQPYSFHETHESGYAKGDDLNTAAGGYRPEAYPAGYSEQLAQMPGHPYSSHDMIPAVSSGYFPSMQGNPQHQPGWGLVSPPTGAGYFPKAYANQRDWSLVVSPTAGDDLPQTPTNQQESNPINSPTPGGRIGSSQPKSVKHLTCWYWANKGCRLPDHVCLYSHFDTGRLADPPVQVQRGRPAVAGKNATNPQPIYKDWKVHHRAHSAVVGPDIQKQIEHIHAKAAQPSITTPIKAEQSESTNMVKEEGFGSAEPAINFNHAHPDDFTSPAPADSYRNMSIGIGASNQHIQQHFTRSPRQMGGNFVPPSPAAQYPGGSTHYGVGGNYSGLGGNYGMGSQHGPGSHNFGGNSPDNPNTPASSGQFGGQSGGPTQEIQKQMRIKDKVITELAGIVEMLEINYGISIDTQTDNFQKFMDIARSLEEEAREAGNAASSSKTKGNASNDPAPGNLTPPYGKLLANHERIISAMEGSLNLVKMEKMVLAKSKACKQVVGGDLDSIKAVRLLPRRWIER